MEFRVQRLSDKPNTYQPHARHSARGRVWINISKPTRRLAKAERVMLAVKVDQPNAVLRIREIAA